MNEPAQESEEDGENPGCALVNIRLPFAPGEEGRQQLSRVSFHYQLPTSYTTLAAPAGLIQDILIISLSFALCHTHNPSL